MECKSIKFFHWEQDENISVLWKNSEEKKVKFVKSSLIALASLKSLLPSLWTTSLTLLLVSKAWSNNEVFKTFLPPRRNIRTQRTSEYIFDIIFLQKRNKPNPSLHSIPHKKIMLVKNLRTMAAMVFSLRRRNFSTFSLTTGSMSQTFIFPLWKRSKLNKSYTLGFHRFLSLKSLICCNQADCLGFKFVKLYVAIKF